MINAYCKMGQQYAVDHPSNNMQYHYILRLKSPILQYAMITHLTTYIDHGLKPPT